MAHSRRRLLCWSDNYVSIIHTNPCFQSLLNGWDLLGHHRQHLHVYTIELIETRPSTGTGQKQKNTFIWGITTSAKLLIKDWHELNAYLVIVSSRESWKYVSHETKITKSDIKYIFLIITNCILHWNKIGRKVELLRRTVHSRQWQPWRKSLLESTRIMFL